MSEARVKGVQVHHLNAFVLKYFGDEGIKKVGSLLPPDASKMFLNPVAHDWYSLSRYISLENAIVNAFYQGRIENAALFGAFGTEESIGRIYRFLFQLLDPETLISRADRIWGFLVDTGTLKFEKIAENRATVSVLNFDPIHKITCHAVRGAFIGALSICGIGPNRQNIKEISCRLEGSPSCVYSVEW